MGPDHHYLPLNMLQGPTILTVTADPPHLFISTMGFINKSNIINVHNFNGGGSGGISKFYMKNHDNNYMLIIILCTYILYNYYVL